MTEEKKSEYKWKTFELFFLIIFCNSIIIIFYLIIMPWNGWKLNPLNYICYNRSVSSLAHHFISHIVSIQMKFTWNFVYVSFGHKCSRQRSVMMLISDSATILVWCGAVDRWLMRYYIIWPAKIFFLGGRCRRFTEPIYFCTISRRLASQCWTWFEHVPRMLFRLSELLHLLHIPTN